MLSQQHGSKRMFGLGLICGISFMLGIAAAPITGTLGDIHGIASKVFWRLDGKNPPDSAITWDLHNVTLRVYRIEATTGKIHTLQFSPAVSDSEEESMQSPENDGTLYFKQPVGGISQFGHVEDGLPFYWGMISSGTEGLKGIIESSTGTVSRWVYDG